MTLKLKYSDKSPDLTIRAIFKNNSNPKFKYGEPIVVKGNPKFIKCQAPNLIPKIILPGMEAKKNPDEEEVEI